MQVNNYRYFTKDMPKFKCHAFYKKAALKIFTRKRLCWRLIFNKVADLSEYCEIFKTYFEEHLRTTAF